ncbi:immunoglobulin-like domain-containing protein [Paenibacillus macerans]|uniref:RCC1 domain-containing protein n=1 Tax=Paenibacillus macerans TaxID=44252 RepID=UPI00242AB089|nr:immunoglobulin-like domain-containing protein [Paenibacillus macerans]
MLFFKSRKLISLILSFMLLLISAIPYGVGAAQAGKGSPYVKVSGGLGHSLALKSNGTVVAWGYNNFGQLNVPAALDGVTSIAAGYYHSLALKSDGSIVAWGYNNSGQSNVPAGLDGVVAIAAGLDHSLALRADGTVVVWGSNTDGQLNVPIGLDGVVAIAAGSHHSLALKSDGSIVAWGRNNTGQLNVPAGLDGVVAIAAGMNHSLALKSDGTVVVWGSNVNGQTSVPAGLDGVTAIAAGGYHSLALKSDGTVVAWGRNAYGQSNVPTELDGVAAIAAGDQHSLALKSDGTIVAWGYNSYGQSNVPAGLAKPVKGTGIAAGYSHSLALKSDGTVVAWGYNYYGQTNVPAGLEGVTAIAAGVDHSLALKADGTVVVWGDNSRGQRNVPAGLDGVVAIAANGWHSLALKADGTVVAWGYNNSDQSSVPAGLDGVVAIAAGMHHSLALKSDGTIVSWGSNSYGQRNAPAGLDGVVAIAAGERHSLALKSDGTVVAWGENFLGQANVPAGLNGVAAIAAGEFHSLALKADGTIVGWGDKNFGQANVPAGLDGVTGIAAGMRNSMALKSDGTVVAWGSSNFGQLNIPGDVRLSGLTVQGGGLNPSFSPSVTAYTYYIGSSVSSVQVTATLADAAHAELYVNNQPHASGTAATVNVPGASTVIPVRVEPYLNPPRTYTITVLRDDTPPDVQFAANGNATPAQNAESTVTVNDAESGVDAASLQYAWSQSTAPPADGWNVFANGDTLRQTSGDGNWYLHIRAQDLAGNVADAVSNAFVLDNTAPELALNGSNPMNIPQGGTYTELGATAFDDNDGVIPSSSIMISGTVDTARLGNYTVQYTAADRAGNTATVTRDVYVYDGDEPAIELIGPNPMTVEANSPFADPGATAYDVQDGDLTASIQVTGAVETSVLGTYSLSYDVSDTAGNAAATVTRTVYVQDTQPPVLTLLGDPVMSVPFGAAFADPGAQATDAYYGDVSHLIVVIGMVDTGKAGVYTLRYSVEDPSGNAAEEVTRTVTVTAPEDGSSGSDDSGNPGDPGTDESSGSGGSAGIFQVNVRINGVVKWVDASYETAGGQRVIRIFPTAEQVSEAFAADPEGILIEAQDIGDAVEMDLPAAPLLNAVKLRQDARLEWSVNGNGLRIPLHVLQGVSEEETVTFMIAAAEGFAGVDWNDPIARVEGELLLPHPIVYMLQAKHGDSIDWTPTYALLTAHLPEPANPYQATAVRIDENGRIRFVPSIFSNNGLVTIRSPYDGAYAVIETDHSFADVNGHWAQEDIVLMANKLLIEGRGQGLFVPDDSVSRAEFAAMLVRALGLDDEPNGAAPFRDVAPGAWYAGAVRAAHEAQLIDGFEDGTFRSMEPITREQAAVMIVRAMVYAGAAPVADVTPKTFADAADIAPWARDAVKRLAEASVIHGLSERTFGPREHVTRAQSAALLKRTLQAMQFINPQDRATIQVYRSFLQPG